MAAAFADAEYETAGGVAAALAQMLAEHAVERGGIIGLQRLNFGQHMVMAAERTLAENHQAAGEDVGAFYRDADRHGVVHRGQIIARAADHRAAAVDVHRVVDHFAQPLGIVEFHHGGNYRGVFAQIEAG